MKKLLVVLLVLGMATPAMAAEWNFYGSARIRTYYLSEDVGDIEDVDFAARPELEAIINKENRSDDGDLIHGLQGNARFGARIKASDQISGRFEYGSWEGKANIRHIYGTYNFGNGELMIGQTDTPASDVCYSNSVWDTDNDMCGVGFFSTRRLGQVRLQMGGFKIALVDPAVGVKAIGDYDDVDIKMPKIEALYNYKSDSFFFDAFAGFLNYDLENNAEDKSEGITAYTMGVGAGVVFGPLTISGAAHYGINYGAYGAMAGFDYRIDMSTLSGPHFVDGDLEDTTNFQTTMIINFTASDNLSLEGGIGYCNVSNDKAFPDEKDLTQMQYYANAVVTFAPGFFIVPEIGYIDYGELGDDMDLGGDLYAGLKWQINF